MNISDTQVKLPNYGSGFDPSVTGIITIIVAVIVMDQNRGFTEKRGSMSTGR